MHELMLILVLGKKADPNLFKLKLEQYCADHGLDLIQFANINPTKKSRLTTRIRGSKRNLMNLRADEFYDEELAPFVRKEGDIRECHSSGH